MFPPFNSAPFKSILFLAVIFISPEELIVEVSDIVWFPLLSSPKVDSIIIFPAEDKFTLFPDICPPILFISFSVSNIISPPLETIPPFKPPVLLLVISFLDFIFIFPLETIFPFKLLNSSDFIDVYKRQLLFLSFWDFVGLDESIHEL